MNREEVGIGNYEPYQNNFMIPLKQDIQYSKGPIINNYEFINFLILNSNFNPFLNQGEINPYLDQGCGKLPYTPKNLKNAYIPMKLTHNEIINTTF